MNTPAVKAVIPNSSAPTVKVIIFNIIASLQTSHASRTANVSYKNTVSLII